MKNRYLYIVLVVAVGAILRFNGYPSYAVETIAPDWATISSEQEQTLSTTDYVSDFALSGYSPALANNAFARRYETHSRTVQNDYSNARTPNFALFIAEESAVSHRLNTDISYAETLVVGLPTEDISFPFNTFW